MDDSYALVEGITAFASHFGLALFMLVVFKFLYVWVTPHNEWKLIKDDKNTAAALGLGGAVVGFSIALGGAAGNSVSLVDFAIWGGVALRLTGDLFFQFVNPFQSQQQQVNECFFVELVQLLAVKVF